MKTNLYVNGNDDRPTLLWIVLTGRWAHDVRCGSIWQLCIRMRYQFGRPLSAIVCHVLPYPVAK